jgi:hypothetical protein
VLRNECARSLPEALRLLRFLIPEAIEIVAQPGGAERARGLCFGLRFLWSQVVEIQGKL